MTKMASDSTCLEKTKDEFSPAPQKAYPQVEGTLAHVPRSELLTASVSMDSRLLTITIFLPDFAQRIWRNEIQN